MTPWPSCHSGPARPRSPDLNAGPGRLGPPRAHVRSMIATGVWFLWQAIRLPLLTLLVLLEPVVRWVLSTIALLSLLTAIFWALLGPRPGLSLGPFLGVTLGSMALLMLYHALIRLFASTR